MRLPRSMSTVMGDNEGRGQPARYVASAIPRSKNGGASRSGASSRVAFMCRSSVSAVAITFARRRPFKPHARTRSTNRTGRARWCHPRANSIAEPIAEASALFSGLRGTRQARLRRASFRGRSTVRVCGRISRSTCARALTKRDADSGGRRWSGRVTMGRRAVAF